MKVDKREYLSGLIGFFPELVMTTLDHRKFLEEAIFVVQVEKGLCKESLSFKHDQKALLLIKKVEDQKYHYFVFQCKHIGQYPLILGYLKDDGSFYVCKNVL